MVVGPVFTTARDIATELGISLARVKAVVKKERIAYGTDRKGNYLLPPNALVQVAQAIIKEPKASNKQKAAAKERAKQRAAKKTAV